MKVVPSVTLRVRCVIVHFVCLWTHFLPTLSIVVALELSKVFLPCFGVCASLFVCWYVSFSANLLLKSLLFALGYGTDYIFHLYDIGPEEVRHKKSNLGVG